MFESAKGKQQVRELQCQEQCIDHISYYLSGCRLHIFPATFLEIAVYTDRSQYISLEALREAVEII